MVNKTGTLFTIKNIKTLEIVKRLKSILDFNLFLNKNVLQNVMEPLVTAKKMNKNEAEKVAKHYLEQV